MRSIVAALMVLVLTMAMLPLQGQAVAHSADSNAAVVGEVTIDGSAVDCCDMPVNSVHHGVVHCYMDCSAIAYYSVLDFDVHAVRYPHTAYDHHITETASAHFRPPIFT